MADNTTLNAGTGGDVIATDDIAGVKHQRVKISIGADGSATDLSSANPLPVAGPAAENAAVSGNPILAGGRYDSTPRTLGNGDVGAVALNASGQVLVEVAAGGGTGGTSAADDADFTQGTTPGTPAMGVYESTPTSVTDGDMGIVGITSSREMKVAVTAGGITAATHDAAANSDGVQLMGVGSSTAPTAVSANGDATRVWTTTSGAVNIADGAGSITVDNAGTFAVQAAGSVAQDAAVSGNPLLVGGRASTATPTAMSADGDVVHAWMTRNGAQVTAVYAQTSGGYTPGKLISAASTNATSVKGSAGTLGYITATNINAAVRYLKLYNKATSPTVGTDTPVQVFAIPGDTAGGGIVITLPPQGAAFSTGIALAITTGSADSDTGAVAAGDVVINYGYI